MTQKEVIEKYKKFAKEENMTIKEYMSMCSKETNLTIEQLAYAVGMSDKTIEKVLGGEFDD